MTVTARERSMRQLRRMRGPLLRRPVDNTDVARQLADEFGRVRRRGISAVDRRSRQQTPLSTPVLDRLTMHVADEQDRSAVFSNFIVEQLAAYEVAEPSSATLLHSLYFDPATGEAPGPSGPGGLLAGAAREARVSQAGFRQLRRRHLLDFASFVLVNHPLPSPRRRRIAGLVVAGLLLVLSLVVAFLAI